VTGRILAIVILVSALAVGIGMYYAQVYAFYDTLEPSGPDDVVLTPAGGGDPRPVPHTAFQAIDSDSSPIRYRACFRTDLTEEDLAAFAEYPAADPLVAPGWFDCYDAETIGGALEDGGALALLAVENVTYGVDRVAAILPDGRGFAWNQINRCGREVFEGRRPPEGCPPAPDGIANSVGDMP